MPRLICGKGDHVGSGCAGLTAAIYAARANLNPLVWKAASPAAQLSTTTLVENFSQDFRKGSTDAAHSLKDDKQAENSAPDFPTPKVTDFEPRNNHIRVKADDE